MNFRGQRAAIVAAPLTMATGDLLAVGGTASAAPNPALEPGTRGNRHGDGHHSRPRGHGRQYRYDDHRGCPWYRGIRVVVPVHTPGVDHHTFG
ncbi:hypothetical protein ACFXKI_53715 [Streptomyces mirabilis]|uniref:hypothetical protein n=1 Tax=Streptomyces mirabilis TaxID=68239 RepID=UPI0036A750AA